MQIKKLIQIYFYVCDKYSKEIYLKVQRHSNNADQGMISDEELLTIYVFCVACEEKYKIKSMYNHIKNYWSSWFPGLPSYQAFNNRLNRLSEAFDILMVDLFNKAEVATDRLKIIIGDSFPVITCSHKRKAKVATELISKGYCASKGLHYYGVKIHAITLQRQGTLPFPQYLEMTPANVHDLNAIRDILVDIPAQISVLDKAYSDADLKKQMQQNGNILLTPIKDNKGWQAFLKQTDQAFTDLFNTTLAKIRQPIEALFNWINEITQIQYASKVRSAQGLKVHVFGKLAAAMFAFVNFNP